MTIELLNRACDLNAQIEYYEDILKASDSCYENFIKFNDFSTRNNNDISKVIYLSNEPELEKYIREYFVRKIESLKQEFAELN